MKQLACNMNVIYEFNKDHEPVLLIDAGETVEIETYDCFENQVQNMETPIAGIDWNRVNPATGPIFVNQAKKGDILKVTIDKIEIGDQGVMAAGPNLGTLGHLIDEMAQKVMPIEDNHVVFDEKLRIPLNTMIGVIGVAPEGEPVSTGTPDRHGGNMDTKLIKEGATLYFPVFTDGALFALGDFHAAMGDGEIGVSGVEVPGKATVTIDVIKGQSIEHPVLTNEDGIVFLASSETLDEATKIATEQAGKFLKASTDLSMGEVAMLLSAAGDIEISQIVDPLLTARFVIPQYVLDAYDITPFES